MSPPSKEQRKSMVTQRPSRLSMEGYIFNADHVLEIALDPATKEIPKDIIENCKGVVIITTVHAGALMTFHYGSGIVMAKRIDGTWSAPSAVTAAGYSMGAVVGGKTDCTLTFIMDDKTMMDFATRPQTRMGLDAAVSAGSAGGDANVGMEAPNRGTVTFTYTNGVFAGLSVLIGTLAHQNKQNVIFYSKDKVSPKSILIDNEVEIPPDSQVKDLHDKMKKLEQGDSWTPSAHDRQRSSRFLEMAQQQSQKFNSGDLK